MKTVAFVTNQYQCDRIIRAAKEVADGNFSEPVVVGILDAEYEIDPQVVDYLFRLSKENKAAMRLVFTEDKLTVMRDILGEEDCRYAVTGMPADTQSVLYDLWKDFSDIEFYTVDTVGEVIRASAVMVSDCIQT